MNYLSTKQLSEIWGISARRIVLLCSEGRIKGAKQIDGRWFIPKAAAKPEDPRKDKTNKHSKKEKYIFPFPLACINSTEQLENFSEEEKQLYTLCIVHESGDFQAARRLAEQLLKSENKYIRLGALYLLPSCCMYLSDFKAMEKYMLIFKTEIYNADEHKDELAILLHAFKSEFESASVFAADFKYTANNSYSDELIPLLAVHNLLSDLIHYKRHNIAIDIDTHELLCRLIESQGYFFCSMLLHIYLALYYFLIKEAEKEMQHFKIAAKTAMSNKISFTLAFNLSADSELSEAILKDYSPEIKGEIMQQAKLFYKSREEYSNYLGKQPLFTKLTEDDYMLISFCTKEKNIQDMAIKFGLSVSGMKKRLSALYDKLGVKSKQEMLDLCFSKLFEWKKS